MHSLKLDALYISLSGWHKDTSKSKLARKQKKQISRLIYRIEKALGQINITNYGNHKRTTNII